MSVFSALAEKILAKKAPMGIRKSMLTGGALGAGWGGVAGNRTAGKLLSVGSPLDPEGLAIALEHGGKIRAGLAGIGAAGAGTAGAVGAGIAGGGAAGMLLAGQPKK